MNPRFRRALWVLGLTGFCSTASANCDSIINVDYASALSTSNATLAAQIISSSPECFGGGPTTALVQMNGTMFQQAMAISSALTKRQLADGPTPQVAEGTRGAAAGATIGKFNVWGNLGETDAKQKYAVLPGYSNGFAQNDMGIFNTVLGIDYSLSPTVAAGLAVGLDRGDGSGGNSDPGFAKNDLSSKGYVFSPYLGWQINREFSLDASAGFGVGEIKMFTTNKVDSDRWYAAANLNYSHWMGNLQLTGRASLLHGVESYGNIKVSGVTQGGTHARNTLDQARLMGQIGYWMNGVMPFAGLAYLSDFDRKSTQFGAPSNPIGRDAWEWRLGANFFSLASGATGGLYYAQEEGRSNQKSSSIVANIDIRF